MNYLKGICPVAEELHDKTFIILPMCLYDYSDEDIQLINSAFHKVWNNLESLK